MAERRQLGLDFDNTIVCYDALFHRLAVARGLVPAELPASKTAVRDHLRERGREGDWTELQGLAYGPEMSAAAAYAGVDACLARCAQLDVAVSVISHKTNYAKVGPKYDLHAAARQWLLQQSFAAAEWVANHVYFEPTREAKLARIASLGCNVFVDDLPEFLSEPGFPAKVAGVLFDPLDAHPTWPSTRVRDYRALTELVDRLYG